MSPYEIERLLDPLDGRELIEMCCTLGRWDQGWLGEEAGINPASFSRIRKKDHCRRTQRKALYYAMTKRLNADVLAY
jgi:hypothetical protein